MITSLALMGRFKLGTGLTPQVTADRRLDLPDALDEMGVCVGCQLAAATPGPYLRILVSYARYATPGRRLDRPIVPIFPIGEPKNHNSRDRARPLHGNVADCAPISIRPSSLHRPWPRPA